MTNTNAPAAATLRAELPAATLAGRITRLVLSLFSSADQPSPRLCRDAGLDEADSMIAGDDTTREMMRRAF